MKAELIDSMGSDLSVVNAARVSFDKASEWSYVDFRSDEGEFEIFAELTERDQKLINYLAKHNHFTPFTHPQITLRETVPIFVARQRFKHVVGFTYNEVSRRYVDDEPEFYVPDVWRSRPEGSVKQGSSAEPVTHITVDGHESPTQDWYTELMKHAQEVYEGMIESGVAPEQARMVLPQSMYTSYYVTGSLAAFARLYRQRIDAHAQKEIQELAEKVGEIIAPMFPVSWKALTEA